MHLQTSFQMTELFSDPINYYISVLRGYCLFFIPISTKLLNSDVENNEVSHLPSECTGECTRVNIRKIIIFPISFHFTPFWEKRLEIDSQWIYDLSFAFRAPQRFTGYFLPSGRDLSFPLFHFGHLKKQKKYIYIEIIDRCSSKLQRS